MQKLFVVTHKMSGGGCERVIAQLLDQFCADGVDCTLVSECKVPSFYPLPARLSQRYLLNQPNMGMRDVPKAYFALRRLVKAERPDVILAMPEKVNVWTVLFLLGTGVPVVVSERNDPKRHPENPIKRMLRRLVYPFAAGFIFQTAQAGNYFSPSIRRRGIVLPNPLDLSRLPVPDAGERENVVVTGGRLHPQKNFPLLIGAFSMFHRLHPEYRLVIYGEGEQRALLTRLSETLPQGAVTLPGQTDRLAECMGTCAMFVLSSDYEGMPNVLIEAMAMGLPCISTDCPAGGSAELIQNGENGLLTPVGDMQSLCDAMCRVAENPALAAGLGQQAARVREKLDARIICKEWRSYLDRIAKN